MDFDNAVASLKALFDAIEAVGVVHDDRQIAGVEIEYQRMPAALGRLHPNGAIMVDIMNEGVR